MNTHYEKHLLTELKKLRKAFYLAQTFPIIASLVALLTAATAGALLGQTASVIALFAVFFVFIIGSAFLQGEYLSIKCPHCKAYFYSMLLWPVVGWFAFLFRSQCNRCGLDLHGKNVKVFGGRKRMKNSK